MVRKKTAKKGRRKTVTRRKSVRRASTKKLASLEERQLAMYHNPFSRATKQPKIPDGKATESLGFQTQAVGEFIAKNATTAAVGDGVLDILLFGGQNAGMIVDGELTGAFPFKNTAGTPITDSNRQTLVIGFTGSNEVDASAVTGTGGTATLNDAYAYWRLVSQGLRLSLLNPQEEDDGWWESVRLTEPMNTSDHELLSRDNSMFEGNMALVPSGLMRNQANQQLVNENSYSTGLLRDLKNHVFKLHPIGDEHDLQRVQTAYNLESNDMASSVGSVGVPGAGVYKTFALGRDNVKEFVAHQISQSHDMIYIRIHGRAGAGISPTRLHYNLVSNQEIIFDNAEREARFHTQARRVANFDEHHAGSRANQASAHIIPW